MNIDVTALELLPEIQESNGLQECRDNTKFWCVQPTCQETKGRDTVVWFGGSRPRR